MFPFGNIEYIQARETHYTNFLGALEEPLYHSTDVKDVHIDIYQFAPREDRQHWTLITSGMSDARQPGLAEDTQGVGPRAEILMYVPSPQGWMYNVLKGLAEMPFDDSTFLHWHHTVPNGMPMTATPSLLTDFFFLPPYFEQPGFDTLTLEGDNVDILWLIPITGAERDFAITNGSQALEDLFAEKELSPVVDEARESLV